MILCKIQFTYIFTMAVYTIGTWNTGHVISRKAMQWTTKVDNTKYHTYDFIILAKYEFCPVVSPFSSLRTNGKFRRPRRGR